MTDAAATSRGVEPRMDGDAGEGRRERSGINNKGKIKRSGSVLSIKQQRCICVALCKHFSVSNNGQSCKNK